MRTLFETLEYANMSDKQACWCSRGFARIALTLKLEESLSAIDVT